MAYLPPLSPPGSPRGPPPALGLSRVYTNIPGEEIVEFIMNGDRYEKDEDKVIEQSHGTIMNYHDIILWQLQDRNLQNEDQERRLRKVNQYYETHSRRRGFGKKSRKSKKSVRKSRKSKKSARKSKKSVRKSKNMKKSRKSKKSVGK